MCIVTGGTYGIGRGIVSRLLQEGHQVIAVGNDSEQAKETETLFSRYSAFLEVIVGDVAVEETADMVVQHAVGRYGKIDVLCTAAGIRPFGDILETDVVTWEKVFDVNVKGVFLFCRAAVKHMKAQRQGVIINFGSPSGNGGMGHIAYCASKGAIVSFTKSLALDHRKDRIRVNAVIPGSTLSGMTENRPKELTDKIAASTVAGRINVPEDIANCVSFLISEGASTISGAIIDIGMTSGEMPLILQQS